MTQWGLDNLFNPGKRHMDDEKRRLQSTREEVGDNSGGRRIDLEGGRVSIAVPGGARRPAPAGEADDADAADDTGVLDAALEAEDLPAVALASDAEIEPEIVQEPAPDAVEPDAVEPEPAAAEVEAPTVESDPAPASVQPVQPEPPAPRRRAVSASVWSRQG